MDKDLKKKKNFHISEIKNIYTQNHPPPSLTDAKDKITKFFFFQHIRHKLKAKFFIFFIPLQHCPV